MSIYIVLQYPYPTFYSFQFFLYRKHKNNYRNKNIKGQNWSISYPTWSTFMHFVTPFMR